MKVVLTIVALAISLFANAQENKLPFKLVKDFEKGSFEKPESVILDTENNVLYVSNINGGATEKNGKGFISKLTTEGEIIEKNWISGLNAPKGMAIYDNKLYVTDIDKIIEIDIETTTKTVHKAAGATFLNDIAADAKGNIFVSNTFGFSGIYKLHKKRKRKVALWLKDESLKMPNGLSISNNKLIVAAWGVDLNQETYETKTDGNLLSVDLKTKEINSLSRPAGNLDGLSETLHGFLISDWVAGKLLYYSNKTQQVLEALDLPKGSADLYFDKQTKAVYICLMLDNKLLKYHFEK